MLQVECHQVGKAFSWSCFCFPVCTSEISSSFPTTWETWWYAKFGGQKKNTYPCFGRSSSTSIYSGSCKFFVAVIHLLASSSCSHCCNSWIFFIRFETSIHPCTGCTLVNLKEHHMAEEWWWYPRDLQTHGSLWYGCVRTHSEIMSENLFPRDALLLISNRFPAHHTPSPSWVFPFDAYISHTFDILHT